MTLENKLKFRTLKQPRTKIRRKLSGARGTTGRRTMKVHQKLCGHHLYGGRET